MLTRAKTKILGWVDSESLRPAQVILYSLICFAGLHMLTLNGAPSAILDAMGPLAHTAWASMLFACPIVVFIGWTLRNAYAGLLIQVGGNISITLCLGTFMFALFDENTALAKDSFPLAIALAFGLFAALITFRDMRKIQLIEAVAIELDRNNNGP